MLIAYIRERFRLWPFLPVALALCAIAGDWRGFPLAVFLLLQFRLWDDLADLRMDRIHHPQRVMSRSLSTGLFVGAAGLLAVVCGALTAWSDPRKLIVLAGLTILLLVWYRVRPPELTLGYHVVLIKYPAFVYLLSPAPSRRALPFVFFGACAYEVLHDAKLRNLRSAQGALAVVALLAVLLGVKQ